MLKISIAILIFVTISLVSSGPPEPEPTVDGEDFLLEITPIFNEGIRGMKKIHRDAVKKLKQDGIKGSTVVNKLLIRTQEAVDRVIDDCNPPKIDA